MKKTNREIQLSKKNHTSMQETKEIQLKVLKDSF